MRYYICSNHGLLYIFDSESDTLLTVFKSVKGIFVDASAHAVVPTKSRDITKQLLTAIGKRLGDEIGDNYLEEIQELFGSLSLAVNRIKTVF